MVCSLFNCFYIILSSKLSIIKIIILHKKDEIIRLLKNCFFFSIIYYSRHLKKKSTSVYGIAGCWIAGLPIPDCLPVSRHLRPAGPGLPGIAGLPGLPDCWIARLHDCLDAWIAG